MNKKSILFVCTGNVFRSMIAEYSFKKQYRGSEYKAKSAGIEARPQSPDYWTVEELSRLNIDVGSHRQMKLNKRMLEENALVIAMSINHKKFIKERFDVDVPLFNEVCHGKKTALPDIWEVIPDWKTNQEAKNKYIIHVVNYIYDSIPDFIKNLKKYE